MPSNKCNLLIGSSNGVLRIPVNSLTVEQVPYHTRPTIAADATRESGHAAAGLAGGVAGAGLGRSAVMAQDGRASASTTVIAVRGTVFEGSQKHRPVLVICQPALSRCAALSHDELAKPKRRRGAAVRPNR